MSNASNMKCLKVNDYIQRTSSVAETEQLHQELENYMRNCSSRQSPSLFDRIIRACNHQLGTGQPDSDHIVHLVKLVELSLQGYDLSAELLPCSKLYMEKILLHIVKNLSSLKAHRLCSSVAELLCNRLAATQQGEHYTAILQNCFSSLWIGLSAKDGETLSPREKLLCQMQALNFLLLLDSEGTSPPFSKASTYMENAIAEFETSCGLVTKDDVSPLVHKLHSLFDRCQESSGEGSKQCINNSRLCVFSEMLLVVIKMLCKAGHYDLASTLLKETQRKARGCTGGQCIALLFGSWAVEVHSAMKAGRESGQALTNCARTLRSLPTQQWDQEAHAVLEGCSVLDWAVEDGHKEALSGPVLLAWFSFLEEQQQWLVKIMQRDSKCQSEKGVQLALCRIMSRGFGYAYESMLASQLEDSDTLDRVLLYCRATAGEMLTELRKLSSESLFNNTVVAVSNLVCGLYNRRLYDQAFKLVEILCRDLSKSCHVTLPVSRLTRPFMLAVQSSRKLGQLELALDWVILWLKVLGDKILTHLAEPVILWVKIKTEAARISDEDIRLRTLRDGFGPDVPSEEVMLSLLDEELRAYKDVAGDTAHERYNTLCDLLDICHEESSHAHLRAVYLCEMAQVVCFQDFSEQTDCSAVDFIHEALRLLEEETETAENADRLKDDKARALLWLYVCTLEKNLQEAIARDQRLHELRKQTVCVASPIETNDFDYEDKQKTQDNVLVHDGLHFNLDKQRKLCKPLEKALGEWSALLQSGALPPVRNPKQTCSSIVLAASLFRLMGKPLMALEAYKLSTGLSRLLSDTHLCVSSLCQSASILLDLGAPQLALVQLEEAEKALSSEKNSEGPSSLSMLALLLKAQYHYSIGQVVEGVPHLCEVLKEVNEQRQSKSWYLLRGRALQTCSSYLSLDTAALPQAQRRLITEHGLNSPDTALYQSLNCLCSLLVTLVGKGLYKSNSSTSDVRFIDQGDNLVVKWQLLAELLTCSMKTVALRSSCGAINDARLQCMEALKLANKLQALSQCAELLVMKAELELLQGEKEESESDLNNVRNLLELCTDFSDQVQRVEVKFKPRKVRHAQKTQSPPPTTDDEDKDILSTRWIAKEPILGDMSSSPPLKAKPRRWLSSLAHESDCQCLCCFEPCLGRVTARWAATQADLVLRLDPSDAKVGLKLLRATLSRCKSISEKLAAKLAELFPSNGPKKGSFKPILMQDVVGRVHLHMALFGLDPRVSGVFGVWKVLEAGLAFADTLPSPVLRPIRAGLMSIKAIASVISLASKKACKPEELFSHVWSGNAPEEHKSERKGVSASSQVKKSKDSVRDPSVVDKTKETKNAKAVEPSHQRPTSSSTRTKLLVPMTPIMKKPGSSVKEHSYFDFNDVVPTLAFTPVQKVKAPASVRKAPRTASKQQFQVYDEFSPVQDKTRRVPAAPRRTKKSRFKVEFSDESDSEANTQAEPNGKTEITKKRTTTRRAKAIPDLPAESQRPKRQTKGLKSTSEDDEVLASKPVPTTKGRGRKQVSKTNTEVMDELEKMRTIDEEGYCDALDISIEQLRTSDIEAEDGPASSFEILRRDATCLERDGLSELRTRSYLTQVPQTHISHTDIRPENLSLDDVESLVHSAWLTLQHLPSPTIFPTLCSLLALRQQDPVTTAMLHAQSFGITSRHRTIRHLANCLKKLSKSSSELATKMEALSLKELGVTSAEQRLTQLEKVFSFSDADSSSFPKSHCQEFLKHLQHLPSGVTVCMMSVFGVKPGEMGESIILSRLEKGSDPVTVHMSTSQQQHPINWLVQEMDSILEQQKLVSTVTEKAKWWKERKALDSRVEHLLNEMDNLLGCWKSLLLPHSSDPQLSIQARHLCKVLSSKGLSCSEGLLKAVLSALPALSPENRKRFTLGVFSQWDEECDQLLQTALSTLSNSDQSHGHVVLILDKYLQKLPWESTSILKSRSVSRMPSLHSLLGLSLQKEMDSHSILKHGVDTKKVYYVLDPDANLGGTRDQFKDWFSSQKDWEGVCGVAPDSGQLEDAVATKDLYIYVGHGAGARFLDGQTVLKQQMRAAALLFGCSSAALVVRGDQEGHGIILNYLMAGCTCILGNLWNVTDRDIDRFTKALLESWLSAGSGASFLEYMEQSRQATYMKHLTGAAPVVYGLPVLLQ